MTKLTLPVAILLSLVFACGIAAQTVSADTSSIALDSVAAGQTRDTNGDGIVDVLVPIVVRGGKPLPGAYGSTWSTEVWLHNGSGEPLMRIQQSYSCPIIATCEPQFAAESTTLVNNTLDGPPNAGALYFVEPRFAEAITFNARLLEVSRRAQPNGIELPVVWESAFRTESTRLIGVPRAPHLRTALRIYDIRRSGMTFDVEILASSGQTLASTRLSAADPMAIHDVHLPFVAFIPDIETLLPVDAHDQRYDIRVKPVEPGQYWAFSSVSDRDTQHVLIISPDK